MPGKFGAHCFPEDFDVLQAKLQLYIEDLKARGFLAEAEEALNAYRELRAGLDALAVRVAARGTETLRQHERNSRVRPSSDGEGGPRLEDHLFCEPVKVSGLPGVVGILDFDALDAVPWWWTQEFGYRGNVGRIIFGAFFHPGPESRPSPLMDKQHAIFEPRAGAAQRKQGALETGGEPGKRGSMEVQKPILAKHFIQKAIREIEAEWLAGFEVLQARYVARVGPLP